MGGKCSFELTQWVFLPYFRRRSTLCSVKLIDFSVGNFRRCKDVYANSFFPLSVKLYRVIFLLNVFLWLVIIYDLNYWSSFVFELLFLASFMLFFYVLLFLVIPCAVVDNQLCMELAEVFAQRCSVKKVFLEVSQNLQESTCANFIERETLAQVFSSELCKISKDTFSCRTWKATLCKFFFPHIRGFLVNVS